MGFDNPQGLMAGLLVLSFAGAVAGGMSFLAWQFANYVAQNPLNLPAIPMLPSEQMMKEKKEKDK
jgi:hypothetical protein